MSTKTITNAMITAIGIISGAVVVQISREYFSGDAPPSRAQSEYSETSRLSDLDRSWLKITREDSASLPISLSERITWVGYDYDPNSDTLLYFYRYESEIPKAVVGVVAAEFQAQDENICYREIADLSEEVNVRRTYKDLLGATIYSHVLRKGSC